MRVHLVTVVCACDLNLFSFIDLKYRPMKQQSLLTLKRHSLLIAYNYFRPFLSLAFVVVGEFAVVCARSNLDRGAMMSNTQSNVCDQDRKGEETSNCDECRVACYFVISGKTEILCSTLFSFLFCLLI